MPETTKKRKNDKDRNIIDVKNYQDRNPEVKIKLTIQPISELTKKEFNDLKKTLNMNSQKVLKLLLDTYKTVKKESKN